MKRAAALLAIATTIACSQRPTIGPISPSTPPGRVVGALEWPVRGALVSAYRPPNRPNHAGVDLAAPPATLVIAAEAGNVLFTGEIRGYEKVVAIAHAGDLTTVYAHLGEIRVRQGDEVARGQPIATVGDGGYLHYELRRAKQPIDPADLYAVGPSPDEWASSSTPAADVSAEPAADVPIGSPRAPAPPSAQRRIATAPPGPLSPEPPPAAPPPPEPRASSGSLGDSAATSDAEAPSSGESSVSTPLVVAANLLYVPAKLVYSGLGAVTGVFVLAASQDTEVAGRFWDQTLGGDYLLTGEHLSGERGVHWMGRND